jgi:hypothetical protein
MKSTTNLKKLKYPTDLSQPNLKKKHQYWSKSSPIKELGFRMKHIKSIKKNHKIGKKVTSRENEEI